MGKYDDVEGYFFGNMGVGTVEDAHIYLNGCIFFDVDTEWCLLNGAFKTSTHEPTTYYIVNDLGNGYSIGAYTEAPSIKLLLLKNGVPCDNSTISVPPSMNGVYTWGYVSTLNGRTGDLYFSWGFRNAWDASKVYTLEELVDHQGSVAPFTSLKLRDDGRTLTLEDDAEKAIKPSEEGGGTGAMSVTSVPTGFPTLPNLSAVNTGFITLYSPSLAEMQSLGAYLWDIEGDKNFANDSKNIAQIIKEKVGDITNTFEVAQLNPIQYLSSLTIYPFQVTSADRRYVKFGYVDSEILCNRVTSQYQSIDCGSVKLSEFWGNALDYNPWTGVDLFLPFCGTHHLDVDDIMDATLHVVYNIDLLTGTCTAVVNVSRENLNSILYRFSGVIGANVPFSQQTHADYIRSIMSGVASVGQLIGGVGGGSANALTSGVMGLVDNALSPKQTIQHGGTSSMVAGMLDNLKPCLIVSRPIQSLAKNYKHYVGYPSNITETLKNLKGFTKVESVINNNVSATEDEKREIERLLKEGVWL